MNRTRNPEGQFDPRTVPNSHLLILRSIAWKYHERSGHDPEDLFSEACYKYLLCRDQWKPKKAKLTTFLFRAIHNHFREYLVHNWDKGRTIPYGRGPGKKERIPIRFVPLEQVEQQILEDAKYRL